MTMLSIFSIFCLSLFLAILCANEAHDRWLHMRPAWMRYTVATFLLGGVTVSMAVWMAVIP